MSDTTRRQSGTLYMTVDGLSMPVRGNTGHRLSGVERETITGMDGIHGYSEKPKAGMIKADITDTAGIGLASFIDMTNVTVDLQLANGKTITGTGMWITSAVEVNSAEATMSVTFEGDNVVEG